MNIHLLKMKNELKLLAMQIKNGKSGRKPRFRNDSNYNDWNSLWHIRNEFRHKHIAYCTIKGRSRQEIEVPREDNLPNEQYIESIIRSYDEAICSGEKRLIA